MTIPNPLPQRLQFGIWLPPLPSWPVLRQRAQVIESLGFDSLWLADHFVNPYTPDSPWMESWTLLAGLAACTQRIEIGTMVTNIIYRHPAVIAKSALSLDHISSGRLVLGLGAGSAVDPSHAMTGVPPWPAAERVDRFEEIVALVDSMLRQKETSFRGRYYQVEGAVMSPPPIQQPRPRLLIAAQGRRTLQLAARFADRWCTSGSLKSSTTEVTRATREMNQVLTDSARSMGRDPHEIGRAFCVGWTQERPFDSLGSFQSYLGPLIEAGITQFVFGYWHAADADQSAPVQHIPSEERLEWLARVAIPSLRGLAAA
jgi:alkanesulfonate monooxygenase SsuD/methylene tetrahydromethanopterin reductase-like flavin-dependent oxidoreductase (luciferase family)